MGYNRKFVLSILFFALLTVSSIAQVKDWDDISRDELEMEFYPVDSSASAVVLFDKAEVDLNRQLEYVMERHVRIKILREEGYKWATAEITYNEELDQEVSRIRGHTFALDNKGGIDKHKLDKDSIFEEELSEGYKKIKFTLPALTPGAVVEFKYRKHIGSPHLLPDWEFQKSIPVAWCEYSVKVPDWFFYNKMFVGNHPLHLNESKPFQDRMLFTFKQRSGFYSVQTKYQNVTLDVKGNINRWVMKDLPAVKKLPYMSSVEDYKSKLWIQLTEIRMPQQPHRYFLKTWGSVAEELRETDSFGGQLASRSEYQSVVQEVTKGISEPSEQMRAIYRYFIESMIWDGSYRIFADQNIEDAFQANKGSSAELNLLLIQLLREAGLQANPVLLSTREHGKIVEYFAIANQFNHVITGVTIGDEFYLLDATSDNSSTSILPVNDLNGNGLLISSDNEKWVKLESRIPTKSTVTINARITDKGSIDGDIYISSQGHDAVKEGLELKELDPGEYFNKIVDDHFLKGAIDSFHVKTKYPESSKLNYSLFLSEAKPTNSELSGDRLYLNPIFFLREEDHPFPQPERNIPVSFPYEFEKEYVINLVVPDGYSIEEVPDSKILSVPGGAVRLKRLTQINQNRITVFSNLSIKKKIFQPEEYQYLREFYSHVVDIHNEQIVLRSKTPSSNNE